MEIDIYSKKGTKVTVTEKSIENGYDSQVQKAKKYLKAGGVYTVERTNVGGWHTDVYLEEFPGINFNSVQFEKY